jgi:hypothetical protein
MKRALATFFAFLIIVCLCISCAVYAWDAQAAPLAAKTETITATLDPSQTLSTPTSPSQATNTPWVVTATPGLETPTPWVVIWVTPTPPKKPPSLKIADLDKKLKGGKPAAQVMFSLAPLPQSASPIPPDVDDTINDVFWPWLLQRELDYYAITGKFCQMLPSHITTIPTGGAHEYPDGWYNHPTDQQYSWNDLNAIQFEPIPFAITIDVYRGVEGPGFVACFTMRVGSDWQRCRNYGPEALRNHDWQEVIQ